MLNPGAASFLANITAGVFPAVSAKVTYQVWTATKHIQRRAVEQACLQKAKRSVLDIENEEVAVYCWGEGPWVLLLHGWNGRATQFYALIEKLLAHNYGVIAFDAPGHGDSTGDHASLNQIVRVVKKLNAHYEEFEALIAHSFGAFVAVNSMKAGLRSKALIMISSPADYELLLKSFVENFGLNAKAEKAFLGFLKKRSHLNSFEEISIHHLASAFNQPCLIVHCENDRQVPVSESYKIANAWVGAELYITQGCGHLRILRSEDVSDKCISFLDKLKLC